MTKITQKPEKRVNVIKIFPPGKDPLDPESKKIPPIVEVQKILTTWYDLRFNEITCQVEGCAKDEHDYKVLNENSVFVRLHSNGYHISLGNLCALLNSDFITPYNPIQEYFTGLPSWDEKTDYIGILANHVHAVDQDQFTHHFRKMLVRTTACGLDDHVFNKHAFVLVGRQQGTGKSSFCRYLCPPELFNYFTENIPNDKDGQIALVQNFMINLDELSTLSRFEINHLKSLFSKDRVKVRHPYGRKSQTDPRRCSFVGSTNEDQFLTDGTGSVRWLCFEIIDIEKQEGPDGRNFRNVPIDKVWTQAYFLYKSGFKYQLTADEVKENEKRNEQYRQVSMEYEAVKTWLEPGNEDDTFLPIADIIKRLKEKTQFQFDLKHERVGRALSTLGFQRTIKRYGDNKVPLYGYFIKD